VIFAQVLFSQYGIPAMQPDQMRAARAALNWSLERLAAESGIHRNTLSNFETSKFGGEPDTVAAARKALTSAGVIFIENGDAPGIALRRFRVGDRVKFRPQTRVRLSYDIAADELGTVVAVEPHPPQTGPTYRIMVQFGERSPLAFVFKFEYELAHPVVESLRDFIDATGRSLIPNGNFVAHPAAGIAPQIESDLARIPPQRDSLVIIPTADEGLRLSLESRGFLARESCPTLHLMWRQFLDGGLRASC
jgi:transcriptional regulator with XRE-family HTH domain